MERDFSYGGGTTRVEVPRAERHGGSSTRIEVPMEGWSDNLSRVDLVCELTPSYGPFTTGQESLIKLIGPVQAYSPQLP